uniref:Ankyrin repeat domain-containing protein n=1 Tax=Neogobius melanostomus TaxID=47308 RepID=A0A8C6V3D0_9GOBI
TNRDILDFLLKKGADPNIMNPSGCTALHCASECQAPPIFVRHLLEAKANPNICLPIGFTALQIAACNKMEAVVKLLISAGALVTPLRVEYLRNIGNHEEIANCRKAEDELISAVEEFVVEKSMEN